MDWLRLQRISPPPPPFVTTLTNPHPSFSVTEDRILNLRETGSQIVIQTIENALRQGGLALLGKGFQLDSSLSYHSGDNEGIKGDLDVVVPLLNLSGHVVFAQPGAAFWTGLEEEERVDGNIGLVYRAELIRDLVAGVSVFYDHDFQIGHSRISGGIDLQSGFFRAGANYYHPLGDEEDGREGFIEEALRGMDARLVFEREVVRLGSTIGYWEYDGGEDVEDEWKTSIGMDFGFRILPGVFVEGSWERHKDDLVLDERIFAGLAFRFSLPGFEGASYGNGEMSSSLHKIVDREKRILYEERVAGPTVSIVRTGSDTIPADEEVTVAVDIQLSEALAEDVTINLVGSGSATYNDDYTISIGGTDCPMVTEDNCPVTITAGQLSPSDDVEITINDDGRTNEHAEDIVLSMVVAGDADLMLGNPNLSLTIPADSPLPTLSLSADTASITEGNTATITLTLSETLGGNATFNLVANTSGTGRATYGTSDDWNLSVGGTDCTDATESSPCQVMISQGSTTATVTFEANTDSTDESSPETATVSVTVDSGSMNIVTLGSSSSLNFTIQDPLPTVSVNYSGSSNLVAGSNTQGSSRISIRLSKAASEPIVLTIVGGGTANYGFPGGDWTFQYRVVQAGQMPPNSFVGGTSCQTGSCQVMLATGETIVDIFIETQGSGVGDNMMVSIEIPRESQGLVELGTPTSQTITLISS